MISDWTKVWDGGEQTSQKAAISDPLIHFFQNKIHQVLKKYSFLKIAFLFTLLLEVVGLVIFFPILASLTLFSMGLSLFFFSLFGFALFSIYIRFHKKEFFQQLASEFFQQAKKSKVLPDQETAEVCHVLSHLALEMSRNIGQEKFFLFSFFLKGIQEGLFWKDELRVREIFLKKAIELNRQIIPLKPLDLQAHASLANAYIELANLYREVKGWPGERHGVFLFEKMIADLESKFKWSAESAIEEFKILVDLAPHDPWVHSQLAYSYRDLNMPFEEIKEYETICRLRPSDRDAFFHLGHLYFQVGQKGKGLKIYEDLRRQDPIKAAKLIKNYGN